MDTQHTPSAPEPSRCDDCGAYYYNAEHFCPIYDGPSCQTCGEPTLFFTVGAPGRGSGRQCRHGHTEWVHPLHILTLAEVR